MTRRVAALAAALLGASMAGCASGGAEAGTASPRATASAPSSAALQDKSGAMGNERVTEPELDSMVAAALADAAERARPGAPAPSLVSAESVTWSDGSLGCPVPGRMYTMALVPGYRIQIRSGAEMLDYHAGKRGKPVLCPAGRAKRPAPNSSL